MRKPVMTALQQAQLQADEARQAITNTKPTGAELEGARDARPRRARPEQDGRARAL
jgi:hypothetical protein